MVIVPHRGCTPSHDLFFPATIVPAEKVIHDAIRKDYEERLPSTACIFETRRWVIESGVDFAVTGAGGRSGEVDEGKSRIRLI
jgi:hypothetical protein